MNRGPGVLKVYEAGKNTLVGFSKGGTYLRADVPRWHTELIKLVERHNTEVLTFDLTSVKELAPPMLEIMYAMNQHGVRVQVFNPSAKIRDVLKVTQLASIVTEVDSPYADE